MVVVAGGEGAARFFLSAPLPWRYPQVRYRPDRELIFSMIPGQVAFTADKPININSRGLRGPELDYARKSGVLRLLFLGDSIVFGTGVESGQEVTARVKEMLARQGIEAEVINSGVPSYNTQQEVDFLRHQGVRYKPDWVIVGMCWNDINDKTGVQVSSDGQLISIGGHRKTGFLNSPNGYSLRNLIKESRLVFSMTQGIRGLIEWWAPDTQSLFRSDVLEGRSTPRITEGWSKFDQALHQIRELSASHGFRTLLVTFPVPIALERPFPRSSYPARALQLAEREGIPSVDLDPPFRSFYHGHDSLFIPYDGDHPNGKGHDLAARVIVEYLLSKGTVVASNPDLAR